MKITIDGHNAPKNRLVTEKYKYNISRFCYDVLFILHRLSYCFIVVSVMLVKSIHAENDLKQ